MNHPIKIAIIGGTGKVGRYIATKALEKGFHVRMLVRNPNKLTYRDDRIEIVQGNIQDVETVHKLINECQIVINTFGLPLRETPIYSFVTENLLKKMKELKISRYIGVSGGSLTINGDNKNIINRIGAKLFEFFLPKMMEDKKKEWNILSANKHIEWTLIRLPFVREGFETGDIKEKLTDMPGTKITNHEIASFIINEIENPKYIHQAPFISN